jgi:hypothetical protein
MEELDPTPDPCRGLVDTAVARARRGGRGVRRSFGFPLAAAPDDGRPREKEGGVAPGLEGAALERRLAAAGG